MSSAKGLRQVGSFDCPGGGQIVVAGTIAFIGHMRAPAGTSIVAGIGAAGAGEGGAGAGVRLTGIRSGFPSTSCRDTGSAFFSVLGSAFFSVLLCGSRWRRFA